LLHPSASFSYLPTGSGDGIKQFLAGDLDFCGTDILPGADQLKSRLGRVLEIPTVIGGVAVIYHVTGVGKGLKLNPDVLADIFSGKITRWNDPRIRETNKQLRLPSRKIGVVHRSDASGTTNLFTGYLSAVSMSWLREVGVGKSINWPVGSAAIGNSGVAIAVKRGADSIGYVELVYALEENLSYAALKNKSGSFVEPNYRSIREAVTLSKANLDSGFTHLIDQPGSGSYPIVGLTWILVYQHQRDRLKGKELKNFLGWALTEGQILAPFQLFVPLPAGLAEKARQTIRSIEY
jgi:phosphate transport system substrate-binding protein